MFFFYYPPQKVSSCDPLLRFLCRGCSTAAAPSGSQTHPAFTMNSTYLNSTNTFTEQTVTRTSAVASPSPFPAQAGATVFQVVTTVAPASSDSALIAVVIVLILLTVAVLAFLLYRYLCHNKGDYRTTGELAPGEDPDEDFSNQAAGEKKEYFI